MPDMVFRLFGLDVNATKTLEKFTAKAAGTGAILEGIPKAILGIGAAGAVLAVDLGVHAVEAAAKFQQNMERLHTQAGVSQADIGSLSDGVLALAGKVGFDPNSLADGLYHVESSFASSGITGKKALNILQMAAEAAKVGNSDLVDTVNALDAAVVSGIPGVQNMTQAVALMNAAVGTGDQTMQDFAEALGTGVLAVAKGYGVTFSDAAAAIAVFGDNNIRGAEAGTALRMSIQALAVPAAKGKEDLHRLGLSMTNLRDAMSKHGLTFAVNDLVQHLKDSHIPMKQWGGMLTAIFGKRAGVGLAILVEQSERFNQKVKEGTKQSKSFSDAWRKTKEQTTTQWDILGAKWQALLIRMGEVLLPFVNNTVLPALNSIMDWFSQNGPQIGDTIHAIGAAWSWLSNHVNLGSIDILGSLQKAASGAMWLKDHFGQMKDGVMTALSAIDSGLLAFNAWALSIFSAIGHAIMNFGNIAHDVTMAVVGLIGSVLVGAFRGLWGQVSTVFGDILHAAAWAFGWIPGIGPKLQSAAAQFDQFAANVNDALAGITRSVNVGVYVGLSGPGASLLKGEHSGYAASAIAKASYLQGRAMGGSIASGVPTLVGENGPEILIPNGPGRIVPNSNMGMYGGGWGGGGGAGTVNHNYSITVQAGVVGDKRSVAIAVVDAINTTRKRGYNLKLRSTDGTPV